MPKFFYFIVAIIILIVMFVFQTFAFANDHTAVDRIGPKILPELGRILGPGQQVPIPQADFQAKVIPSTISIMLQLAGSIAFIVFTVAGIILIVAHGNEELQTKAKNIFLYAIVGLTIIALSYAIIYGVFTLRFDQL